MESARVIMEVVAGVIPGQPMPEYTKRWGITSREWYGPEEQPGWAPDEAAVAQERQRRADLLKSRYQLAQEYAVSILDPACVNWVRVEWLWL